jgi:UDP-glucose 6-dehydrogenase
MTIMLHGYGWVGKAMETLFKDSHTVIINDPAQGFVPEEEFRNPLHVDYDIICVPTPSVGGALDCSTVLDVIMTQCTSRCILIRSTLQPGFTEQTQKLLSKRLVVWPEYLGETVAHPLTSQKSRQFAILGGRPAARREAIELLTTVYNASLSIRQVDATTAEVIKLSENRAIAFKVAQCQELYDVCEKAGIDYYEVREAVYGDDPRFNLYWSFIYPNARGFNSKCIPKDVYGWCAWAESVGYEPLLTNGMLSVNEITYLHLHE